MEQRRLSGLRREHGRNKEAVPRVGPTTPPGGVDGEATLAAVKMDGAETPWMTVEDQVEPATEKMGIRDGVEATINTVQKTWKRMWWAGSNGGALSRAVAMAGELEEETIDG